MSSGVSVGSGVGAIVGSGVSMGAAVIIGSPMIADETELPEESESGSFVSAHPASVAQQIKRSAAADAVRRRLLRCFNMIIILCIYDFVLNNP